MADLAAVLHGFIADGVAASAADTTAEAPSHPLWRSLSAAGSRLWLDTGDIDAAREQWSAEFAALTTNNTLLNNEIQKGIYDGLVREAAAVIRDAQPGIAERDLLLEIAFVLNAWHGLRLVRIFGADVSVELHTDLAHDVERTVAYGRRYHALCPEHFYVKVPLTPSGYLGAGRLAREGVRINFTLGFSARQNVLAALLTRPAYVNVFMGRLNAFVADHGLGSGEHVGEAVTLATQRALRALRNEGRSDTGLIGASIRSGSQLAAVAGVDVLTIPVKAAADYVAHGAPAVSRVADRPAPEWRAGVDPAAFAGPTLWDVDEALPAAADALAQRELSALTPGDVRTCLADHGVHNLLPDWTDAQRAAIADDGKIPSLERWSAELAAGRIGLDALMNEAGLQSFTADQRAFDDRVVGLLHKE